MLFNILTSVESSSEAIIMPEPSHNYSDVEIIFWYAAFIVTIIVFIIVMRSNKNIKKNINKTINIVRKLIKAFDEHIVKLNTNSKKAKDIFTKVFFAVNILESKCLDLKDSTKLNEFDGVINQINEIEILIKEYKTLKEDLNFEQLNSIKDKLITIENELQRIKLVIK